MSRHAVFLAASAAAAVVAAAASANESRFSSLVLTRCAVTGVATTDEGDAPLPKSEQQPDAWRCRGHAGRDILVAYGHQQESIAIGRRGVAVTDSFSWRGFNHLGPRAEWRGPRARGGGIEPVAVIVRWAWDIRDRGKGAMLGVVRLGRATADSCLVAWVDAVANADAEAIARRVADEQAAGHRCDPTQAVPFVGAVSPAGRE